MLVGIIIALLFHICMTEGKSALEVYIKGQVNDQLAEYTLEIESLKSRVKSLEEAP